MLLKRQRRQESCKMYANEAGIFKVQEDVVSGDFLKYE